MEPLPSSVPAQDAIIARRLARLARTAEKIGADPQIVCQMYRMTRALEHRVVLGLMLVVSNDR